MQKSLLLKTKQNYRRDLGEDSYYKLITISEFKDRLNKNAITPCLISWRIKSLSKLSYSATSLFRKWWTTNILDWRYISLASWSLQLEVIYLKAKLLRDFTNYKNSKESSTTSQNRLLKKCISWLWWLLLWTKKYLFVFNNPRRYCLRRERLSKLTKSSLRSS